MKISKLAVIENSLVISTLWIFVAIIFSIEFFLYLFTAQVVISFILLGIGFLRDRKHEKKSADFNNLAKL